MYLKSITIQGFKSFANKIVLEFHNGITAIVGPNGSGKSNIADAVRWVLGEQSAKQLRGGSMTDVIFSGTENRKPLGFAMVSITFDNADRRLNLDAEEVTVSRRLYRSGESEYRLNGRNCRLKDINEMFFDTGIGKEGYSIIGQGQIDKILSGKPEERRQLFDEAAGIVKFKRRKAASLKKLEQEEANLTRVNDILTELSRQLQPLEVQSEKAVRYLKLREEMKEADLQMFCAESSEILRQEDSLREKRRIAADHQDSVRESLEQSRQEYERAEQELAGIEEEIHRYRDSSAQDQLKKQQMEGRIDVLREKIRASDQNHVLHQKRLETIAEELRRHDDERTGQEKEREQIRKDLDRAGGEVQASRQKLKALSEQMEGLDRDSSENRNATIKLLNRRSDIKERMQRYDTMLEQITQRRSEIASDLQTMQKEEQENQKELESQQALWETIRAEEKQLVERDASDEKKLKETGDALEEKNRQIEACRTEYHRESSRLESLRNIAERYEGYGSSVRRIMQKREENPGIHGVVAELIHTGKQYETAIETALGGSLQNIVTDNENTAKYLIEYLKRGHYGRATFLPLTAVRGSRPLTEGEIFHEKGVIGPASKLTEYDSIYEGIVNRLLGKTIVVDSIDHAIAIGRKYHHTVRMVTIEGDLLNPGGSMTGGAYRNSSNLLGRRREIEELTENVKAREQETARLQEEAAALREREEQLRRRRKAKAEALQKKYLEENTARMQKETLTEKENTFRLTRARLEREKQELDQQVAQIRTSKEEVARDLAVSKEKEENLTSKVSRASEQMASLRQQEVSARAALEKTQLNFAGLQQRQEFLAEQIHGKEREIRHLEKERSGLMENISTGKADAEHYQDEIEKIKADIASTESRMQENAEQEAASLRRKEEVNQNHRTFFARRDELSDEQSELEKELVRLDARLEKLDDQYDDLVAYLWDEYEISPDQVPESEGDSHVNAASLRKHAAELKKEIRELGSVNVNAIDEYKELKKRHDFLSSQHEDLTEASTALKGIIRRLDEDMRHQFMEKFGEIQKEYDHVFQELFGGGKGTLELVEGEDILDAGIVINAQPPGKKLQNMMQLSGGEKALTAIALLFAIQNLKPSPFCLLDETEAALDDSNVVRYADYLRRLSANTQFIIITHRRGTMAAADRLYGITMQEKGISTLVSVNLVEKELEK